MADVAGAVAGTIGQNPKLSQPRRWRIPFVKSFDRTQLKDGKAIGFKAKLTGGRAAFNVATGPSVTLNTPYHEDNISLHVLFQEGKGFLLSSLVGNEWKEQQTFDNMGVEVGEEVYVRAEPHGDAWKVVINGQEMGYYNYTVPLERCSYVFVEGDVELHQLQFEADSYMVPFEYPLKDFRPGKLLWISGFTNANANRIDADFYSGDDIAFKFQVRFDDGFVVRNTKKNGEWGKDETDGGMPFSRDADFTLEFDVVDDCFEVYVNDKGFVRYFHRMSADNLTRFELKGDVEVKNIDIQNIN